MADDKAVMDQVAKQQGDNLLQQTKELPYMKDKEFGYAFTPNAQGYSGHLESYAAGEEGTPQAPRPTSIPMNQFGVQVINPKTTPQDVMADYVSHYAVNNDPKLQPVYQQLLKSFDPKLMQERYMWDVKNSGEKRPFDQWLQMSGAPAMMRGYVFNQWPKEFQQKIYTPEQVKIMDQMKSIMGLK